MGYQESYWRYLFFHLFYQCVINCIMVSNKKWPILDKPSLASGSVGVVTVGIVDKPKTTTAAAVNIPKISWCDKRSVSKY